MNKSIMNEYMKPWEYSCDYCAWIHEYNEECGN